MNHSLPADPKTADGQQALVTIVSEKMMAQRPAHMTENQAIQLFEFIAADVSGRDMSAFHNMTVRDFAALFKESPKSILTTMILKKLRSGEHYVGIVGIHGGA